MVNEQADNLIADTSHFSLLTFLGASNQSRYETAASLYSSAAAGFRLLQKNGDAGEAFEKAAQLHKDSLNEPLDAAASMLEAAKAYRTESCGRPEDAVRCLEFAVGVYCRSGCIRRAAKLMEDVGNLYETQINDTIKAAAHYETAAEWYRDDSAHQ
jgi:alpha-soluble NSF attachment protein